MMTAPNENGFKLATEKDIPVILEMMKNFYAIDKYPFYHKKSNNILKEFIQNSDLGRIWLITENNTIIGYVALTFGFSFEYGGRDIFIDELFIKERFRNKGIGKQTLLFIENQAKLLGVKAIHLEVENKNEIGKNLYSKLGYSGNQRSLLTKRLLR